MSNSSIFLKIRTTMKSIFRSYKPHFYFIATIPFSLSKSKPMSNKELLLFLSIILTRPTPVSDADQGAQLFYLSNNSTKSFFFFRIKPDLIL